MSDLFLWIFLLVFIIVCIIFIKIIKIQRDDLTLLKKRLPNDAEFLYIRQLNEFINTYLIYEDLLLYELDRPDKRKIQHILWKRAVKIYSDRYTPIEKYRKTED